MTDRVLHRRLDPETGHTLGYFNVGVSNDDGKYYWKEWFEDVEGIDIGPFDTEKDAIWDAQGWGEGEGDY